MQRAMLAKGCSGNIAFLARKQATTCSMKFPKASWRQNSVDIVLDVQAMFQKPSKNSGYLRMPATIREASRCAEYPKRYH